ncbi:tRNA adenosine(34) deaminase TadA [Desulfovibrio intestinalis]|uniref:tRNA-specific adenosine deaminase n=1 Tax=Desulfovibrio intestinalis TaxID=58621 RepID=A0A7W8C1X4_9BACT|nr:tRNA adenosine(34) deaminase TadA [Desulfovibrio intestinalis]MBB5143353.1 tRNA(adenine34) deaminase [Desulfovibrio intestinalis]
MRRQASNPSFPHPGGLASGNGGVRVFAPAGPVPSAPPGHSWESLMGRALERATMAASAGEIPVGAVLVAPDGRVLAEEGNAPVALHDPTAHAEIQALRRAGTAFGNYRLGGCVLVVTLEPCAMCAAACIHARLAGVVYGAADSQAGAVVSRAEYFDAQSANHSIWHMGGIRAEECAALLHDFFAARREE